MKLAHVLTATTNNPLYCDFIPIFIKTWEKLFPDIKITILFISPSIPDKFKHYKDYIVLFKPLAGVSTVFTSQYIRLLYPSLIKTENKDDAILITDMDMLPMNTSYYQESIKNIPNNKFVYYRGNILMNQQEMAICYNIATPQTWLSLFNVFSMEKLKHHLQQIWINAQRLRLNNNIRWSLDQKMLYDRAMKWNKLTKNLVLLNDKKTKYNRLCRSENTINSPNFIEQLKNKKFTDYHCHRPYKKYQIIIDKIIEQL